MDVVLQTEAPPLQLDVSGALRVGNSRVLLELIIRAFEDGSTPEAIAQRYPTTTLPDIYAVIAYYLRHQDDLKRYLDHREQQAQHIQQHIEQRQGDLSDLRGRLLARLQRT